MMSERTSASPTGGEQTAARRQPEPPFYAEVDTPALVLDKAKLQRNIRKMADFAAGGPAKLRPHAKTHKCVEIAKLQLEAGAIGITCAKLGEAEALAEGGIPDILIANQIVGPLKIARLVELGKRCTVTVAVDDADNVAKLSAAAVAADAKLRVLVEVNVGMDRCGVEPGEPALALARQVDAAPGLVFAGLQAYAGHLQNVTPFEERAARARADMSKALTAKQHIEAAGLEVTDVSGCGTGTHTVTGRLPWMTELQVGSYATMDAQYASVGGADYENALTVLVTVISRPRADKAIIDAGLKAVTPEFGDPTILVEGATWLDFSEEHGEVVVAGAAQDLRVGDKIELIPRHGCTTVNLYDKYHVVADGALVDVWKVAARGRCQ
jgi:D-serine deaminase-like pyridoxal phosphate-dependent protein